MADRTAIINGLTIDTDTGAITIGRGATGYFSAALSGIASGAIDTDTDIALLIVSKASTKTIISTVNGITVGDTSGDVLLKKQFAISVDDDGNYEVNFSLNNAETKAMAVGSYLWNAVIITDPSYDESGEIVVEESDAVVPFYTDGDRPAFDVEEVGCVV